MIKVDGYEIPDAECKFELELPDQAQVLTVQAKGNAPSIWAKVDTEQKPRRRTFHQFNTGSQMPKLKPGQSWFYIGSYQLDSGIYILHVFEVMHNHL